MKLKEVNLIFFFFVFGFAAKAQNGPRHYNYLNPDDGDRTVVLYYDAKSDAGVFQSVARSADLSPAEIIRIEKMIKQQVDIYNRTADKKIVQPEKYFRQYLAVIDKNGDKQVFVNCFCQAVGDNWKNHIQYTFDGGGCYFRIWINLSKNYATKIFANGIA